nr:reverse transcriptase domain-containing protein [Nonomuraea diastatica]
MAVEIPKAGGGTRVLGVPTVADRVAQTVAALALEPRTESIFHDGSYGYRPRRSALDAVATCRQRCWKGWPTPLSSSGWCRSDCSTTSSSRRVCASRTPSGVAAIPRDASSAATSVAWRPD